MSKLIKLTGDRKPGDHTHLFFCPGCQYGHGIEEGRWTITGTPECPTVRASILLYHIPGGDGFKERPQCHSFITDGRIEFLSDSTHHLSGQTVDLPDF